MKIHWRKILLIAFGMSMFTSLVYEVVWTRYASLVFGSTVYSVSAILTSIMAGLAIGSYWYGKKADKTKNSLRLFSKLEWALALYSIALIGLFKLISLPYFTLFNIFGNSFMLIISIFAMSFIILFVPTVIIGATFPLMSKTYTKEIGKDISDVYAVDTIFAGCGALCAGFIFLPYFGLFQTTILAALINTSVGYLFYEGSKLEN